jgi:hypothetical protein
MRGFPIGAALFMLSVAGSSIGCGFITPIGKPTAFPLCEISGRLTVGGQPLAFAGPVWITFFPEDGALGDPVTARVAADGVFRTLRAPVGKLHVRLDAGASTKRYLPPPLAQRFDRWRGVASPWRFTSKNDAPNELTIDLMQPM